MFLVSCCRSGGSWRSGAGNQLVVTDRLAVRVKRGELTQMLLLRNPGTVVRIHLLRGVGSFWVGDR